MRYSTPPAQAFCYFEPEDILKLSTDDIAPGNNVKTKDLRIAQAVLDTFDGSFIGGSILVNSETAGDVDVIVPMINPRDVVHSRLEELGFEHTFDAAYTDTALELDTSWRCGKVNAIVINPLFYTAYALGAYKLRKDGEKFAALRSFEDRVERVQMHIDMKNVIREWIKE